MCTYLTKRESTYYFRRPVPAELRGYFGGRREWTYSLGTKDRAEAKRLIPAHTIKTDALIEAAAEALQSQSASAGSAPPQVQKATQRGDFGPSQRDMDGMRHEAAEAALKEARREDVAGLVDALRGRLKGSTAEMPRHLRAIAYLLQEGEFDRTLLRDQLTIAKAELAERHGDDAGTAASAPPTTASAVPLLDTFDRYAAEQKIKPGTAKEWRGTIQTLIDFLGHDDAARITADDLDRWRDHLLAGVTKRGTQRDPRTVRNGYFAPLRAALNWAVEKRKLPENVAAQIVVRVPKKAKLRDRNFTDEEARTILAAAMAPAPAGLSETRALARRWVPWLCAYTGARVNEISQLRGSDVTQMTGVWTIRITPEAGTVKGNIARIVPLHPHLIEQGFPAVAQAKGDQPIFYDSAKVRKPGAANRHFKKVGEQLAHWVRNDLGITDPGIQPNHAWRHTFKSKAIDAGIPERVADAIQGHAPRSVGQTYGSVSIALMRDAIKAMPRYVQGRRKAATSD